MILIILLLNVVRYVDKLDSHNKIVDLVTLDLEVYFISMREELKNCIYSPEDSMPTGCYLKEGYALCNSKVPCHPLMKGTIETCSRHIQGVVGWCEDVG